MLFEILQSKIASVVALTYVCWYLLCLLHQLPRSVAVRVSRLDPLGLLPNWRFFAPKPFSVDHHLVIFYRSNPFSDFVAVEIPDVIPLRPRPWQAFWNPERRLMYGFVDAVTHVIARSRDGGNVDLSQTVAYQTLLNYVRAKVPDRTAEEIMFSVVLSDGFSQELPPVVAYTSGTFGLRPHAKEARI